MPRSEVTEHWVIVGTPPEAWSVEDGVIACAGNPMGDLRTRRKYKNYILRGERMFESEGWTGASERWPNAGFLIHATEQRGWT